jgi:uncharacterized SAM-binding protein YcdF (DUF218 family)
VFFYFKKICSALLLPPVSLLAISAIGITLIDSNYSLTGYSLAYGGLTVLFVLSLPIVANHLLRRLEKILPISFNGQPIFQAIVVLGAGKIDNAPEYDGSTVNSITLQRLKYAVHLRRWAECPILVSGGAPFGGVAEAVLMEAVLREDFNVHEIWVESKSRDSWENATLSTHLLKNHNVKCIALVSEACHLRRSVKFFEKNNIEVVPAPTGFLDSDKFLLGEILPKASALDKSARALKEYLASLF